MDDTALRTPVELALRPTFYCPLPPAGVHPAAREIDQTAVSWLHTMKFGPSDAYRAKLAHADFGLLSALATPRGHRDRVQWAADFLYWGFALDDARDEPGTPERTEDVVLHVNRLQRILEAPETGMLPGDPLAEGERQLQRRLLEFATPTQIRRYTEGMRAYYFTVLWEITNRNRGVTAGLDDYAAMRMKSAGHPPMTAMLEIVNGYELEDRELDRPVVRALTEINWLLVAWDNDLYSYAKEAERYGSGNNLIEILAHEADLGPEQAMDEALRLRDRVMCLFHRLQQQALRDAGPALQRYVTDLGTWIRANIDWGTRSARYRVPSGAAEHPVWTTEPHDDDPSPIPLPSVQWWWSI